MPFFKLFDYSPASYKGKFHPGVDLGPGSGTTVYSPVAGTLVASTANYGTVTISNTSGKFLFGHMTNRIAMPATGTKNVKVGDVIGKVAGIGANGAAGAFAPHLHVEVHSASAGNGLYAYEGNGFKYTDGLLPVHNYF